MTDQEKLVNLIDTIKALSQHESVLHRRINYIHHQMFVEPFFGIWKERILKLIAITQTNHYSNSTPYSSPPSYMWNYLKREIPSSSTGLRFGGNIKGKMMEIRIMDIWDGDEATIQIAITEEDFEKQLQEAELKSVQRKEQYEKHIEENQEQELEARRKQYLKLKAEFEGRE
jgi:hypothetical protein